MWMIWILLMLLIGSLKVTADEEISEVHRPKESSHAVEKKRQDLIPYPRMGRSPHEPLSSQLLQKQSTVKVLSELENRQPFSIKFDHDKTKDGSASVGSVYLLPYPRPGRELYHDKLGSPIYDMMIPSLNMGRSKRQDSMLPYPRLGRDSALTDHEDNSMILPYPRIGRDNPYMIPYPRPGRELYDNKLGNPIYGINDMMIPSLRMGRSKRQDSMLPYPRLGRDSRLTDYEDNSMILPYPRVGRDNDYLTPYPRVGKSFSSDLVPYPRFGRSYESSKTTEGGSDENVEFMSQNSDYMTPYPRLGKRVFTEDGMIPYPRLGRSDSDSSVEDIYLTPYPRLGKRTSEDTLLPYPRIGRSYSEKQTTENDNEDEEEEEESMQYLTPYPRLGRQESQALLPEEVLSQILKSISESSPEAVFPQLRLSRSNNNNNMRDDNQTSSSSLYAADAPDQVTMIPNPRFGRSKTSHTAHNRKRRNVNTNNQVLLPYPRLGRDTVYTVSDYARNNIKPYFTVLLKNRKSDSESNTNQMPPNSPDLTYLLPYPRPGRSKQLIPNQTNNKIVTEHRSRIPQTVINKNQESDSKEYYLLPYPRPGRSLIG